jgi:hypothetical protein
LISPSWSTSTSSSLSPSRRVANWRKAHEADPILLDSLLLAADDRVDAADAEVDVAAGQRLEGVRARLREDVVVHGDALVLEEALLPRHVGAHVAEAEDPGELDRARALAALLWLVPAGRHDHRYDRGDDDRRHARACSVPAHASPLLR